MSTDGILLNVRNLTASYDKAQVLHGLNFVVRRGEIAVLLGANGAGKTTTLRALTGLVRTTGSITFAGEEIVGRRCEKIATLGVAHVPQGRGTMSQLSVEDNLRAGAYLLPDRKNVDEAIDYWFDIFPRLAERRGQQSGGLSGGEQQMLAIARAMVRGPKLLLLDEPSLGLAPLVTQGLFETLGKINEREGTTMLIVEQNAQLALGIGSSAMVIESGSIVLEGPAQSVADNDELRRAYLGY